MSFSSSSCPILHMFIRFLNVFLLKTIVYVFNAFLCNTCPIFLSFSFSIFCMFTFSFFFLFCSTFSPFSFFFAHFHKCVHCFTLLLFSPISPFYHVHPFHSFDNVPPFPFLRLCIFQFFHVFIVSNVTGAQETTRTGENATKGCAQFSHLKD